jgi:hypothetical protein
MEALMLHYFAARLFFTLYAAVLAACCRGCARALRRVGLGSGRGGGGGGGGGPQTKMRCIKAGRRRPSAPLG